MKLPPLLFQERGAPHPPPPGQREDFQHSPVIITLSEISFSNAPCNTINFGLDTTCFYSCFPHHSFVPDPTTCAITPTPVLSSSCIPFCFLDLPPSLNDVTPIPNLIIIHKCAPTRDESTVAAAAECPHEEAHGASSVCKMEMLEKMRHRLREFCVGRATHATRATVSVIRAICFG